MDRPSHWDSIEQFSSLRRPEGPREARDLARKPELSSRAPFVLSAKSCRKKKIVRKLQSRLIQADHRPGWVTSESNSSRFRWCIPRGIATVNVNARVKCQ